MRQTKAEQIINSILEELEGFSQGEYLVMFGVTARMPASVRHRYCHIRLMPASILKAKGEAYGNNLRSLTRGVDYLEFSRVSMGGKTMRGAYYQIKEAVIRHNKGKAVKNVC